ncbi:MAG TPA: DUF3108 domain-containing protein [Pseudolabrys sp.]
MLPALAVLAVMASPLPASAQGRLDAQYTVTLAGIPIGKGNWLVDITDSHYSAAASGVTTGLMRAFTGGQGTTAAQGMLQAGKPMSSIYAATITTRKKTETVRFAVSNGAVGELKLDSPPDEDKERVPITDADLRGVQDPMTGMLLRAPGNGSPLTPEACHRTLAVFDGKLRYDLQLAFKRLDTVKADKGYAGPVLVCAVYFTPVAGYVPSRATVKYLSRMRDMEVWLAPIAGTRVLVPFRAQGPTPIGLAVLEADQFVSVAEPTKEQAKEKSKLEPKAASKPQANGAKAQ